MNSKLIRVHLSVSRSRSLTNLDAPLTTVMVTDTESPRRKTMDMQLSAQGIPVVHTNKGEDVRSPGRWNQMQSERPNSDSRCSMSPTTQPPPNALKFVPFTSLVKVDFWSELSSRKLDKYRLNDDAQPVSGFFGSGHPPKAPCRITLLRESFAADEAGSRTGLGPRFEECCAMGYLKNVNTKEAFRELDKPTTLAAIAREIWDDAVESDRAIIEPERLVRFLLLTFADLKKSSFLHWFAFPMLGNQALFRLASCPMVASSLLRNPGDAAAVIQGLSRLWARSVERTNRPNCPPFFVISMGRRVAHGRGEGGDQGDGDGDSAVIDVMSLAEFEEEARNNGANHDCGDVENLVRLDDRNFLFGFVDPCSEPGGTPGGPLRNFLMLLSARWGLKRARVLCFREYVPRARNDGDETDAAGQTSVGDTTRWGLNRSVIVDIDLSTAPRPTSEGGLEAARKAWLSPRVGSVGWEPNTAGRPGPRMADLSSVLDPTRLAENSVRLNIKLMRWRALPELDVELLSRTRCLLLGAGTLGCAVARCLLGWGVQHITLADNGRVSYSNPVRQSLFVFDDCAGGGRFKAEAAAAALTTVYPGVTSTGHVLTIPMPGHPPSSARELGALRRDAQLLEDLVSSHDAVYILTDSRESRWLPTLLAAKHDKLCINAALGLDSFLVVRHGGAPTPADKADSAPESRLGCYFCTDVVAPENSSLNRTLDQQCTVTRPGLAPMAASTAVEMTVGLLHHPLRHRAPADDSAGRAKGLGAAEAAATSVTTGDLNRQPLGALPHQVRGFIASFTSVTPSAIAFDRCTACSAAVVEAHKAEGVSFVEKACRSPQILEEVSGLEEMRRGLDSVNVDLEWGVEDELDDEGDM